jgi:hypothetical protein
MASIGELASIVAEAEGLDEATVSLIARYLREAGFIQKKGRGPSAASMLTTDAANLLIAVNASTSPATAAEVLPVYRNLVAVDWTGKEPGSKIGGSFGEALEGLLDCAIAGRLPDMLSSAVISKPVRDAFEQGHADLSVTFVKPNPFATIQILDRSPGLVDMSSLANTPLFNACGLVFVPMNSRPRKRKKVNDREDQTKIGKVTIFSVARILRPSRRRGLPEISGS